MRIEVPDNAFAETLVVHGKARIEFNASAFDQRIKQPADRNSVFKEINAFWSYLPADKQQKIFDLYAEIYEIFENVNDPRRLHMKLLKPVAQLLEQHNLDDIGYWVNTRTRIKPPPCMKVDFDPNDTRDMTYLRQDYEQLVYLTIALRCMMPIWGQYIVSGKSEYGNEYKEYRAMGLIANSDSILMTNPMKRLERYIEASINSNKNRAPTTSSILGGLGTAELPYWVLAQVLIRLVMAEITDCDDNNHLVKHVYHASMNRKFIKPVKEKRKDYDGGDEDNSSIAENYKVKQVISDGDITVLQHYTENINVMARQIDDTLDPQQVELCYLALKSVEDKEVHPQSLVFPQWIIKPALPPRSIPSLSKVSLIRVMAVTQAALWHWGFPELACLVGAQPYTGDDDQFFGMAESKARIPKALLTRLVELYPYYRKDQRQMTERQGCPAYQAIERITKDITVKDWKVYCPDALKEIAKVSRGGVKVSPPDLRAQLAELVILVAEREIQRKQPTASIQTGS